MGRWDAVGGARREKGPPLFLREKPGPGGQASSNECLDNEANKLLQRRCSLKRGERDCERRSGEGGGAEGVLRRSFEHGLFFSGKSVDIFTSRNHQGFGRDRSYIKQKTGEQTSDRQVLMLGRAWGRLSSTMTYISRPSQTSSIALFFSALDRCQRIVYCRASTFLPFGWFVQENPPGGKREREGGAWVGEGGGERERDKAADENGKNLCPYV